MTDSIVLYGNREWTSPYVFSVFVALAEKGLPFRVEVFDLSTGEHRREPFASASITGRVPALSHGDMWVAESTAIIEYLEDVFAPPTYARLLPAEPRARARARMVQAFVRSDLMPVRVERPTQTFLSGEKPAPLSAEGQAAAERLIRIAERLLPDGADFLAGEFSIADADLAMMLQRLVANHDPCPPRLARYADAVFRRPSVRAWLAHTAWTDR